MQGMWKSEVGGWNHKDSRRKTQKFNQLLKDRGIWYSRKEPKDVVRYQGDIEYTPELGSLWRPTTTLTMYICGNLVEDWRRWTFYDDGKRRKIAQRTAHHADRVRVRNWIAGSDWEAEIKTHALSKSIAWEVY